MDSVSESILTPYSEVIVSYYVYIDSYGINGVSNE
jgi:hypothetical protein